MWFAFHCYQSKVINKITDKNQLQIDSGLRAMKIDVALLNDKWIESDAENMIAWSPSK